MYSEDTPNWLLEKDNPSVRYFAFQNLLGRKGEDRKVIEAKKAVMELGSVPKILSHQSPDGSFLTYDMKRHFGELQARSGYLPKYKATTWQAIFLAQLGADPIDERVKKLGSYILDINYSEEHRVVGLHWQRKGRIWFDTMPCYVGNMVWSLSKLGFYEDERIQNSIKWLVRYQRFDDGNFKTPTSWPYRGSKDRCFSSHSCYIGCTKALKAMTVIPEKDRDEQIQDFVRRAVDFLLLHKVYKQSRGISQGAYRSKSAGTKIGKGELIRKEYLLLTFPLTHYDDLLEILETLLFFEVKDPAIDEAIDFILQKRTSEDRWLLEKNPSSSSIYAKFEGRGKESKWITYRALNVLRRYLEITGKF